MRSLLLVFTLCCALCWPASGQGLLDAFSKTGPGRPPAIEDQIPPDGFLMIFGEQPQPGAGGVRVTVRDLAKVVQWRQNRRQFKRLSDAPLDDERVELVMSESGGLPIVWESVQGALYVAVIHDQVNLTHFPYRSFVRMPVPLTSQAVVQNLVARGVCIDPYPERLGPVLGNVNTKNCKE
jgi:hypothetical protein